MLQRHIAENLSQLQNQTISSSGSAERNTSLDRVSNGDARSPPSTYYSRSSGHMTNGSADNPRSPERPVRQEERNPQNTRPAERPDDRSVNISVGSPTSDRGDEPWGESVSPVSRPPAYRGQNGERLPAARPNILLGGNSNIARFSMHNTGGPSSHIASGASAQDSSQRRDLYGEGTPGRREMYGETQMPRSPNRQRGEWLQGARASLVSNRIAAIRISFL